MIRYMTEADIPAVQLVAHDAWRATYDGIIPVKVQEEFLHFAYNEERLKERLMTSLFLVALVDNDIVAFANFGSIVIGEGAELLALYVHPLYQGKGIGKQLLYAGMKQLPTIPRLVVHVEAANERAITFYEDQGFLFVREVTDNFLGHRLQTIQLVRDIHFIGSMS